MPTGHLLAFAVPAFVIIVIPGPSVMFIVGRALALDKRSALWSVLGNTVGEYLQVVILAFGLGLILQRSVVAFETVKLLGAAYLVWLGVGAWRKRGDLGSAIFAGANASERAAAVRIATQGFTVGATNPKTLVFLSAILPQFVDKASGAVPVQILLLGGVFSCIALASDSLWALAAASFRAWFARSPRRLRLIGGIGGLAIITVGVGLAVAGRKD